jgi:GT2 family glycosyltransferase
MTAADPTAAGRAPRVSVLMTTYNGERFIAESIDSVLAQSFDDFELIVVDDNSTDNTRAILARYDDPRMKVLHNATNLGVVGARNRGFAALRGAYVATLDHDDLWAPTRLRDGVDCLDANPDTVLAATRTKVLVNGSLGAPAWIFSGITPPFFHWVLLMICPVVYSSLLFRKDVARRDDGTFLRPDLRYADDHELMLRLAFAGRVEVLDEELTIYRVHGANTTRRVYDEMHLNAVTMLSEAYARFLGDDAADAARLVALHVTRGYPVPDRRTSQRLGGLLARLVDAFIKTYHPGAQDRARIERHAGEMYWRVLRARIRGGQIWSIGDYWHPAGPAVQPRAAVGDMLGSLAAGLLRLPGYLLGQSGAGPHTEGG